MVKISIFYENITKITKKYCRFVSKEKKDIKYILFKQGNNREDIE